MVSSNELRRRGLSRSAAGGGLTKVTGSFTPESNTQHFEVTGLAGAPKVVICMIHDPETNAYDGTIKTLGFVHAFGATAVMVTNNGGTGRNLNSGATNENWLTEPTPQADGTVASTAYTVIVTETGFSAKSMANNNYTFKAGYTYDWVAYI